jgi:hypothetical protein
MRPSQIGSPGPKRHYTAVNYRIAKALFALDSEVSIFRHMALSGWAGAEVMSRLADSGHFCKRGAIDERENLFAP